jgi:conjugative relaxase-like TrwC/TraI family protein
MISIGSGHSVAYLTGPIATAREGYYTGAVVAGEPAGQWYGAGAEVLGLSGEVDADVMEAIYSRLEDPRDPDQQLAKAHRNYKGADAKYRALLAQEPGATPERRAEMRAEAARGARQAIAFEDATFDPVKSVTVLGVALERAATDARAAGDDAAADMWAGMHRQLEDAVMAGARASIDYLQDTAAYARVGDHGGKTGRWADSHRWVVAQFLQHDSRDRDPQLHVHQAILNLQQTDDGRWWRLDTVAIKQQHHAAGAVGARVMMAELAESLGLRFETRPDGFHEVVGVPEELKELFSSRRRAITPRIKELVQQYTDRVGREPSLIERSQIAQRATLETRARKSHTAETNEERLDRWERQTRQLLTGGLGAVAQSVLTAGEDARAGAGATPTDAGADDWSAEDVIDRAIATVSEKRGSWLRADLVKAVNMCLPANLNIPAADVREVLEGLADRALERVLQITPVADTTGRPAELVLANGADVYSRPGQVYYTTPEQVAGERMLRAAAVERGAVSLPVSRAESVLARFAAAGRVLNKSQAAAVRGVLTSGALVEVIAAPAGTGKTYTVGPIADEWTAAGYAVHGLAPSQVAAGELVDEGLAAWNTTRWLNAQRKPGGGGPGAPPPLRAGDLVVVDEAGMTSTKDLAAILELVRAAGAKLVLVGDERQLAAVGAGGAFADVAARGIRYELAEVRRFTNRWEREASLRLRTGDVSVLDLYDRNGRIVAGGTPEQAAAEAARRWLADTVQGREALLVVGTNAQAAEVSGQLRAELVRMGRVAEDGAALGRDGNLAGIGDLVQARHNGWDLQGWAENTLPPINRECYRVTGHREDGGLTVEHTASGTRVELPPGYVDAHLTLAYASTANAAQGRTVDTSHDVAGPGTSAEGLYVPLTRGRDSNTVYVVTHPTSAADAAGAAQDIGTREAKAVLADILERERTDRSALTETEIAVEDAGSTATLLSRLAVEAADLTAGRTGALLDVAAATGAITDEQRVAIAADPAAVMLERLMRQVEVAGHDPAAVLSRALGGRSLDGTVAPAAVLHDRITKTVDLSVRLESAHELIPRGLDDERWQARLEQLADAADDRRRELGQRTADAAPAWAVAALGAVPEDPIARAEWEHRAGWAAAHRERVGHTDATDPLGPVPPAAFVEQHAMWRTAHLELDLPDRGPDEEKMSTGQLRCRLVAAERDRAWAPKWVGDALSASAERLAKARADAALWSARAREEVHTAEAVADLQAAAESARLEAVELERTVEQLRAADEARGDWFATAAPTMDAGERARVELDHRGIDPVGEPKLSTAAWLEAHRAAMVAEDPHRTVTDGDVDTAPADAGQVLEAADTARVDVVETAVPDIREVAVPDPSEHVDPDEPTRRVPTADELAETVERARVSALEYAARTVYDAEHEAEDAQTSSDDGPALGRWADEHDDAHVDETAWV